MRITLIDAAHRGGNDFHLSWQNLAMIVDSTPLVAELDAAADRTLELGDLQRRQLGGVFARRGVGMGARGAAEV